MRYERAAPGGRWGILLCCVLVAASAFLAYAHVLGYFFNDRDSLILIETGRVGAAGDIARILTTRPVFSRVVDMYRPLSLLSYGLDYSIWGLDPFGYHLTDLVLHVLVALLVFAVAYSVTRGDRAVALLGALIFTLHPLNVEVVPSPERRHDVMATLFFLISFLIFTGGGSRKRGALALLFYGLALCSKEMAIVLPLVVWAYYAVFADGPRRIREGFRKSAPLYIVTAAYVLWRIVGPGVRVHRASSVVFMCRKWMTLISSYFTELVYPVHFVSLLPRSLAAVFLCSLAGLVLVFFWITCRKSLPLLGRPGGKGRGVALFLLFVSLLSCAALLLSPLTVNIVERAVGDAYRGEGFHFIGSDMEGRGDRPLAYYVRTVNSLLAGVLSFLFFSSWLGFLLVANAVRVGESLRESMTARILMFLFVWLLIFFFFYFAAARFELRYLYLPAIPFSIALSAGIVASFRSMVAGVRRLMSAVSFFLCAALAVSLVAYSPLFRAYGGWRGSGEVTSMFCERLLLLLPDIPRDGVLYVRGFPESIASYDEAIPHARSVEYPADYSVRSWLDLNDPGNERQVILEERVVLDRPPAELRLELERGDLPGDFVITVVTDGCAGPPRGAPRR